MNRLLLVLGLMFGALLAIFSTQNTGLVSIRFLGWTTDSFPLALVILGSAFLGMALGSALTLRGRVRRRLESGRQNRRIRDLESRPPDVPMGGTGTRSAQ